MRLRIGLPREEDSFDAEMGDWRLLREPGMRSLYCLGVGIAAFTTLILIGLLRLVYGEATSQVSYAVVLILILAVTPLHEMIHAVLLPGSLLSEQVTVGFSAKPLGCYTSYSSELGKGRVLVVSVGPLVALTIVPFVSMLAARMWIPLLVEFMLANGMGSAGDLIYFFLVYKGIPDGSRVRTNGMKTYWRLAAQVI